MLRPLVSYAALAVSLTIGTSTAGAATKYVKASGIGSGTCSTWATACTLSYGLSTAQVGDSVWVQAGTYAPFSLPNGVKTIGGFAGTETLASQSNPFTNITVVDGGDAVRCVESRDNASSTMLRGFTIRNGRDTGYEEGGGGLMMLNSSAMIVQCVFDANSADWWGGAVAIRGTGAPQFINCEFRNNGEKTIQGAEVKPHAGAAIFLYGGSPTITNCLFHGNKSGEGPVLAPLWGMTATFINCTMVYNQATVGYGGAIFDQEGLVTVRNSIVWGNTAVRGGNQFYNHPNKVTTVTHSNVEGGWTGTGNINADPVFASGYRLQVTSPCKNTGLNTNLPADVADLDWDSNVTEPLPKDLLMLPRKIDFTVDMGAFEEQTFTGGQ